jgi:hypothetical protein
VTPREQLEYAAEAMGLGIESFNVPRDGAWVYIPGSAKNSDGEFDCWLWNPLTDQSDSDRMACKLRIEPLFFDLEDMVGIRVYAESGGPLKYHIEAFVEHDGTDEDVCRAVRKARLLVAVEIGKMK